MTNRRKLTPAQKAEIMAEQAEMCALCHEPLDDDPALGATQYDHNVPLAIGGADDVTNIVAVHAACHARKTNDKRWDAPLLGSDKAMIAKARRLSKGPKQSKGRKLQSRGFPKGLRKKLNGEVVKRDE